MMMMMMMMMMTMMMMREMIIKPIMIKRPKLLLTAYCLISKDAG